MPNRARSRFVLIATVAYAVASALWIGLSDQLLALVADVEHIVWLSAAKGMFFVAASSAGLLFALRAVPSEGDKVASVLQALQAGMAMRQQGARWPGYLFALAISVTMLAVRHFIGVDYGERLLMILFMLPIGLSAVLGGLGPGLLSTTVCALGMFGLSYESMWRDALPAPHDLLQWGVVIVSGLAVSVLSEVLRRSVDRGEFDRRLLAAVVNGTSDAVFVKDLQGCYLLGNAAGAEFAGLPLTEILGCDDHAIFPESTANELIALDRAIISAGRTQTHEERITTRQGRSLVFDVTKGPVFDRAGKVVGLFGISRDITQRAQASAALKASAEALRVAQQLARLGSWDWDLRSGEHRWSEQIYAIYGRDPSLPPATFPEVQTYFIADSWQKLSAAVEEALARGQAYECDAEVQRPDGSRRWIVARGQARRDADGELIGLHGTVQDITEQRRYAIELQRREQQLERVLDGSEQGFWDWNLVTNEFQVSARWEQMLGYAAGEMDVSPEQWPKIVHPDDLPGSMAAIEGHLRGDRSSHEAEFRARTKTGEWRWILTRGRIVERDATGRPLMMSGTHTDITERKQAELALRDAATVFESSYEGIMMVSAERLITKINPAFTRITGYLADEALGQSPSMLSSGRHSAAFYAEMWRSIHEQDFWRGEIWNRRKDGELFAELLAVSVVRNAAGAVQHYIGVFSDISQLKAHEAELDQIANYDDLTGVPNRRLLSERLAQAITHARLGHASMAVCYVDLDGFKDINDAHGHAVGDQLLIQIAQRIRAVLRGEDMLARLGGDEFVLLLYNADQHTHFQPLLDRILTTINEVMSIDNIPVRISASMGVTVFPDDDADADTLLRHADQAMYLAKDAGKNRYQLFDLAQDRQALLHREQQQRMVLALQDGEFVLHYQPKVDLSDGTVIGAEALIRWQHPDRGLLAPADFLPQLDELALEVAIGEWVIDSALAQVERWREAGLSGLSVSVNVSAEHLLSEHFVEHLQVALMRHAGVAAELLELEILETVGLSDMSRAIDVLTRCRALGVSFALDDFGTGYSSLAYFRNLPVQVLKIDQSFVRGMLADANDLGIVDSVVRLAQAFNRPVIAEGVETLSHAAVLLRLGCRYAQGYGIARPMPPSEIPAWAVHWLADGFWRQLDHLPPSLLPEAALMAIDHIPYGGVVSRIAPL